MISKNKKSPAAAPVSFQLYKHKICLSIVWLTKKKMEINLQRKN